MSASLRLVVFDVDGTLVDSQHDIVAAMTSAFGRAGLPAPPRTAVLGIVGLSLEAAMARLVPGLDAAGCARLAGWYRAAYMDLRARAGAARSSPPYPHVPEVLAALAGRPDTLLGVATGKSRRGLDSLLEAHGLAGRFATLQAADAHPSKPHPSMLLAALEECGVAAGNAVMIGDTSYDMEMAQAAGVCGIGVSWGYHGAAGLGAARQVIDDLRDLPRALDALWTETAA